MFVFSQTGPRGPLLFASEWMAYDLLMITHKKKDVFWLSI